MFDAASLLLLFDSVCTYEDFLSGPLTFISVCVDTSMNSVLLWLFAIFLAYEFFVCVDTSLNSVLLWMMAVFGSPGSDFVGRASTVNCGTFLIIELSKCSEHTK